ncbi:MAG TPA: glutaredoxin domain-containing protein [Bacillota bacterium]|nr:glutaredoxin domain-containing protein [Bacillota bacterium]
MHVKEYLSQKAVDYKEYDVASDSHAREEMMSKSGGMAVPTLLVDGKVIVGFDKPKLDKLLQ